MRRSDTDDGWHYKHYMPQYYEDPIIFSDRIEIGEWDMSATSNLTPPHHFDSTDILKIVSLSVIIRNDAGTKWSSLDLAQATSSVSGYFEVTNENNFKLFRWDGGSFDDVNYNATASTVANRGFIYITYEV